MIYNRGNRFLLILFAKERLRYKFKLQSTVSKIKSKIIVMS